jgi:hypothetical protein
VGAVRLESLSRGQPPDSADPPGGSEIEIRDVAKASATRVHYPVADGSQKASEYGSQNRPANSRKVAGPSQSKPGHEHG